MASIHSNLVNEVFNMHQSLTKIHGEIRYLFQMYTVYCTDAKCFLDLQCNNYEVIDQYLINYG